MTSLSLQKAASCMNGQILNNPAPVVFTGYNIDSRKIGPGELFFSIVAERDGHDFIDDAIQKGASGAVISKKIKTPSNDIALIYVDNTLQAIQDLAATVRQEFKGKVVGITGSIGKTTTKVFASRLLANKYSIYQSKGNFNNHLGLPLTLLNMNSGYDLILLEMGMNAPGEIALLTGIADPDIAVITNVKPVHLEFFKNIDEIALAKKEILKEMKSNGIGIFNGDDTYVKKISKDWKGKSVSFGLSKHCMIKAEQLSYDGLKGIKCLFQYGKHREHIRLPFLYQSYVYNFLAASAIAFSLKVQFSDILDSIKTLKPISNRGEFTKLGNGIDLIDDSYNSSPEALESALFSLQKIKAGRKVAILGDMLELGPNEIDYHIRSGSKVKKTGWDILITVGSLGRYIGKGALEAGMNKKQVFSFDSSEKASHKIGKIIRTGDLIFVKGSRGIQTEKIIAVIKRIRF